MTTMLWSDHILPPGLTSARPAATAVAEGAIYASTDDGVIYRNNGTTWDVFASTGASMLAALADVDLTGLSDGDFIAWDLASSTWVVAAAGAGGTAAGTTFTPTGGLASTDVQAALAELDTEKAALASPTFTGNPTAPTPTAGDSDTSIATTAFVAAAILAGGGYTDEAARDAIGAALVQGANIAITVNDAADTITIAVTGLAEADITGLVADLAAKAPLASPTFTGDPKAPTPTAGDNDTSIATTAFVKAALDALINSAPGTLDTLGEIATQLATDESAVGALTTTVAGKLAKASNLSDLANAGTARTNLGLGGAAVLAVGTTAGTVAAGDDSRLTNSRAPTAHAASHAAGGSDALTLDDSQVTPITPNDQTGTTYTFVLADKHRLVTASNASAQTYTVPPNSSVAYPLGTVLSVVAKGAGQVTLAPGAGVTLNSAHGLKTSAQWATVSLTKILTDTWVVSGDTTT